MNVKVGKKKKKKMTEAQQRRASIKANQDFFAAIDKILPPLNGGKNKSPRKEKTAEERKQEEVKLDDMVKEVDKIIAGLGQN